MPPVKQGQRHAIRYIGLEADDPSWNLVRRPRDTKPLPVEKGQWFTVAMGGQTGGGGYGARQVDDLMSTDFRSSSAKAKSTTLGRFAGERESRTRKNHEKQEEQRRKRESIGDTTQGRQQSRSTQREDEEDGWAAVRRVDFCAGTNGRSNIRDQTLTERRATNWPERETVLGP